MFLNGILAGFVALGAIPVIIHLLNRSRFKVVQWAAMEFILRTLQKNSRRIQLRDIILMLLRTAAIILAALALARPTIAPGRFSLLGGTGGGVTAVVVLDNSMSMATRDANDSRFEISQRTAKTIIDQLPRGSSASVILMSDIAVAEVAEPTEDLAYLSEAISRAQVSDGGTSIASGMQAAWDSLKKLPPDGREIYLVTDLQEQGWPKPDERAWIDLIGEMSGAGDLRVYIADAGATDTGNVSVERLAFTDELVGTDGVSTLVATVRNHGSAPATQVPVDLVVDDGRGGALRPAATTVIDQLDGSTQVRLQARFEHGGRHRVEVRTGPDHLLADNARRLVVDVIDRFRVLVVDGSAEGGATGGATFLRAAMSPGAILAGADTGLNEMQTDRIETTIVAPGALAGIALDDFEAVILSDVAEPSTQLADGLKLFVAGGKGLVIFLGGNARPDAYNRLLGERGLLPGVLGSAPRTLGEQTADPKLAGMAFATKDLSHPIVSFFADPGSQKFLAQPRILKAWPLAVPEPQPGKPADAAVAARLADGTPAIATRSVGRGQVITYCMPADKEWSDLPLRPAFLMLLQRTVQLATLGNRPRLSITVHEPLTQSVSARDADQRFVSRDPRGGERFLTPQAGADGQTVIEQNDTPYAGFYAFAKGSTSYAFAVNPPADESAIATIERSAVEERLAGLPLAWIGSGSEAAATIERGRVGREIWTILLILAIACLIAESVLALRWAPKGT